MARPPRIVRTPEGYEAHFNKIVERLDKVSPKKMTKNDWDTLFLISMIGGLKEKVECFLIRIRENQK